jgi:hypothetical protein
MRVQFNKIALAAIFGLAITFTLSCSNGDDNDGSGNGNDYSGDPGEGITYTYDIENVTESSFTMVNKEDRCYENGTWEENAYREEVSYSINDKALFLWRLEFNGSSSSLIGTWTREPFSASCEENDYNYYCEDNNNISKAVFTQDFLTVTACRGKIGERDLKDDDGVVVGKIKFIDCGTVEETRGTETVRIKFSGTEIAATYRGKTCKASMRYSESKMREACTEAYNKALAEGYDGSGYVVEEYYYEIRAKDIIKCLKDNNFPEWFH